MKYAILIAALLASGRATRGAGYVPVVDTKYKDPNLLQQDTGECQQFARQRMDTMTGAVVVGLVLGLLGAVLMPRGFRNDGFKFGAVVGAASGATEANDSQETIIKRCLAGRGYNVLN